MAGVITTGSAPKALWPGMKKWFGMEYDAWPTEYTEIFTAESSDKAFEEVGEMSALGLAGVKPEGSPVEYDDMEQNFIARYNHAVYAKGVIATEEAIDDDQYGVIKRRTVALARSARITKEVVHANILNRAFNSSYTMGGNHDGKELLATDHPQGPYGGTYQNELTTAADLSEASLEDLLILIGQAKDARGLQIMLQGVKLIVPVQLQFVAQRLLDTELRPGTSDNDVNAVRQGNYISGGHCVNHYLTDADAWFIKTNCPDGLTTMQRWPLRFAQDNEFNTSNLLAKAYERYSTGWSNPRGLYGSPGA